MNLQCSAYSHEKTLAMVYLVRTGLTSILEQIYFDTLT